MLEKIGNNPVWAGIITGFIACLVFNPIGGIAIGIIAYHMAKVKE